MQVINSRRTALVDVSNKKKVTKVLPGKPKRSRKGSETETRRPGPRTRSIDKSSSELDSIDLKVKHEQITTTCDMIAGTKRSATCDDRADTKRQKKEQIDEGGEPSSCQVFRDSKPPRSRIRRLNTRQEVERRPDNHEDKKGEQCHIVPPEYRLTYDANHYAKGVATHDKDNAGNVLHTVDYVTELYQNLFLAEETKFPRPYMHKQSDINSKMRAILIDWLVEVHMKFRLFPETLYLCVNIIDRYCSKVHVERSKLQLVGVTALLIACKYEEIYPPEVRDCVYITDRAYNRNEVLEMEQKILKTLSFSLTVPTGYPFLQRFLELVKAKKPFRSAASYYMERTLQEHDLLEYRPSLVSAAAVLLAINHPDLIDTVNPGSRAPGIPQILLEYTGFKVGSLLTCAEIISTKVGEEPVTATRRQLVAVKRKFEVSKYDRVSSEIREPNFQDIVRALNS